jgi:hypothetical protein
VSKTNDLDIDQQNADKSKRGKRARNKGNAFEREVAARLGGVRVGQYGGKTDVQSDLIVAQCKVGNGSYSERYDGWLRSVKGNANQMAALVVGDAPGPGTRRRTMIVIDFDDFCELLGVKRVEG